MNVCGMAGACLTFAHLFSFQVSYADLPPASTLPSAGGTKMLMDAASLAMGFVKKKLGGGDNRADDIVLKRGIFEVDFTAGSLTLADKDKAIAVQEFQAFKRKFAGDGDLFISLHFQQIGNECWDITIQNRAEKTTLNHLLEEAAKEWIYALEDSIEYTNNQGAGNQSKQAAAGMTQGRAQRYDDGYTIPNSNRLQNLQLADETNAPRSAGQPYYSRPLSNQLYGDRQQISMNNGPYNQDYGGAESYTDAQGYEKDYSEYTTPNSRLVGKFFETNQASNQDYQAPYPASGFLPGPRNADSSYAGGPSDNVFATLQNTTSGFVPSPDAYQRKDANATMFGGMRGNYCSQGGLYLGRSYQDPNPNSHTDPHQQRVPSAYSNVECSRNPYESPLVGRPNPYNRPLGGAYGPLGGTSSYASQGNYASPTSHQQYTSTQASNRNKAAYDPWASRMDMKDSDSE